MTAYKSPTALRTIGEVAQELGVATHVLRFWESKFKQIKPQKRRGRRYYRPEDVVTITQIKTLLYGQGYTIRGVQKFFGDRRSNSLSPENSNAPMLYDELASSNIAPSVYSNEQLTEQNTQYAQEATQYVYSNEQLKELLSNLKVLRTKIHENY